MNTYIDQYKMLHATNEHYGPGSSYYFEMICILIDHLRPALILDFGCGKGGLVKAIAESYPAVTVLGYDPAVPEFSQFPDVGVDFLISTDVLEHIPEDVLPSAVEYACSLAPIAFFGLHHAKARNILPNGENAHCTVKPHQWYLELFKRHYPVITSLKGVSDISSAIITTSLPAPVLNTYNAASDRIYKALSGKSPC